MIWLRFTLLVTSVVMVTSGAVSAFFGQGVIPYDVREQFPVSWAVEFPGYAVAGFALVFITALLWRPGRTVYVKDFSA